MFLAMPIRTSSLRKRGAGVDEEQAAEGPASPAPMTMTSAS
jgi:hypothetical protein